MHDGAAQPHAEVGIVLAIFGVAEPRIDHAMAADEGFAAVDDNKLAVVTLVHHADVVDAFLVEENHLAAGRLHQLALAFADLFRSGGGDQLIEEVAILKQRD